jgi:ketosteroid isomerase-like protein
MISRSLAAVLLFTVTIPTLATPSEDAAAVAALDVEYQHAVKVNDDATMARILHEEFILVLGEGTVKTRADLLREAREEAYIYEQQDEEPGSQKVRVWGDTAVVTAKLWLKGRKKDSAFDYKLWFSDTYIRTPGGWRYVFGQASLPLGTP